MEDLTSMIAAAQFGITVCSLGLGAVAEPAFAAILEPIFHDLHIPDSWLHPAAFTIGMSVVVYLHVVLGEMVPKNLALAEPERAALVFGPPMVALVAFLKPVVRGLNVVADAGVRLMRIEPRSEVSSTYTHEEVEALVDESHAEGLLEESEYARLAGALDFTSQTVTDVLLPMESLQTVTRTARTTEVEAVCAETGFSRFPVVDDGGDLVGYLHIKDVLEPDPHGRAHVIEETWIRPFADVHETDTLVQTLQTLQSQGAHMARVVNDDAEVLGVATLEDVIEELVGEIRDAAHHDEPA
jgi:CBS domain containing-hemolysin-like protein